MQGINAAGLTQYQAFSADEVILVYNNHCQFWIIYISSCQHAVLIPCSLPTGYDATTQGKYESADRANKSKRNIFKVTCHLTGQKLTDSLSHSEDNI